MKKRYFIILFIPFITFSCKKFLDMPPKNTKVMVTMEDVKMEMSAFLFATLNSYYASGYISNPVAYNGSWMQYPFTRPLNVATDLLTNDIDLTTFLQPSINTSMGGNTFNKIYSENKYWEGYSFSADLWNEVFNSVGYLNSVLKDLDVAPDYDKENFERISGEARVIRAYYLLRLNQLFSPNDDNDLGIPFNLDANIIKGGGRWKQTDLYKKLIGEINEVLEYGTPPEQSWNIFFSKKIMYAILAQTYQYKASTAASESSDWDNAVKYAKLARDGMEIESSLQEQIELSTVPFDPVIDKPHRFALIRFALYSRGPYPWAPWGRLEDGVLYQSPTNELYDLYDPNDIRKSAFFTIINDKPYFSKLLYTDNHNANDTHILFHYSDMMLIEAEGLYNMGNIEDSRRVLNEFKKSKIIGYTGYDGNDILTEIFNERRKEFVLEEQMNWIDLKRRGKGMTRRALDEADQTVKEYTLDVKDYRYTLPLPDEIELNYNNIPQNPGWK